MRRYKTYTILYRRYSDDMIFGTEVDSKGWGLDFTIEKIHEDRTRLFWNHNSRYRNAVLDRLALVVDKYNKKLKDGELFISRVNSANCPVDVMFTQAKAKNGLNYFKRK